MRFISFISVFCLLTLIFGCSPESGQKSSIGTMLPDKIDFNYHVKPILSDRCYKCHGPDENARKAELRFDLEENAFALRDSSEDRYAIVPGDLKRSEMAHRISSQDPDYMMPPPESNLSLSDREIEILKRWIQQGAEWKPHWSFIPPERPDLPEVENESWPKNGIDYFILTQQESVGLNPSQEADKARLIRRVSFDLSGLPPSPRDVDKFLADESPEVYENMVDRVLESPAYGERMAIPWLDLARYADTHGYQDDDIRAHWPWRDWVIKAFNENMPFDQFVTWQLAGDLLPDPTYEQKLATAFNRNHMINAEGGAIPEEYRVEYVADRTQTLATAFLGLTMQCTRCHDHKYDPISQKEFYQLFSFFNSVPEKGLDGVNNTPEPSLELPETQVAEMKRYIQEKIDHQKQILEGQKKEKRNDFRSWEQKQPQSAVVEPASAMPSGLIERYDLDFSRNDRVANLINPKKPGLVVNGAADVRGKFSGGLEFNGQDYLDLGNVGDFDRYDPFSFAFWMKTNKYTDNSGVILVKTDRKGSGYELTLVGNKVGFRMNSGASEQEIEVVILDRIPWSEWNHLVVTYDGSAISSGVRIYLNGDSLQVVESGVAVGKPNKPVAASIKTTSPLYIGGSPWDRVRGIRETALDEVLIFNRVLTGSEVTDLMPFNPMSLILGQANLEKRSSQSLYLHYLHTYDDDYQASTQEVSYLKTKQYDLNVQLRPTMIMQEMDTTRPAYVLNRGHYAAREEQVYPGTPARIMEFSSDLSQNRLGLAHWLLDPRNPLTARVTVNRLWQMLFGEGIVSTVDDFGNQGALPSHPELLDWLAVEFVESGWDVKHMLRLMVSSAAYRQSSKVNLEQHRKDPQNRWLARGPQYRMSAETIRDNVLAISGLLVTKIGGPSVKPYQPYGLWLEISSGRGTARYDQGRGDELYRKSLYTFWKRTIPPPSMLTFDAATRNYCVVKRQATSTPLQALVLLNDPQVIEASRAFAERMIAEGGETPESRIQYGFRTATSRYPEDQELESLTEILELERKTYEADPEATKALLSVGERSLEREYYEPELAAYSVVASAIFNLDETVTKY